MRFRVGCPLVRYWIHAPVKQDTSKGNTWRLPSAQQTKFKGCKHIDVFSILELQSPAVEPAGSVLNCCSGGLQPPNSALTERRCSFKSGHCQPADRLTGSRVAKSKFCFKALLRRVCQALCASHERDKRTGEIKESSIFPDV